MENKIVFEDKNLRMEYVANGNYIHETWWGTTVPDVFNRLLDIIIQELENTKATGIILDAREHKGLGPASQERAAKKIGEYAAKVGRFRQAIIVPKDVFSKFSVENFSKKLEKEVVVTRYFEDVDSAQKWLQEEE